MKGERIYLSGVPVDPLTVGELHDRIAGHIEGGGRARVLHVNVHGMNLAARLPWFHGFLNRAEIVFCDGVGVQLGARILGHRIPERITYADWLWELASFCAKRGYSLYFLGGSPGIARRAADRLEERFPELRIAGVAHGYFDKRPGSEENADVLRRIQAVRPDILVVGFGMPLQERWLFDHWDEVHARVALSAGAAFDYVSGTLQRAPGWVVHNGFEWAGRLAIEPRRLWRRYVLGNPAFLARVLRERLTRGWTPRPGPDPAPEVPHE